MNFDLRPLVYPSYWLTLEPPNVWDGAGRLLAVLFVGMLIASVVVRRRKAADKLQAELYRRVSSMLATMGSVGIVLYFLSYEGIRLLGARPLYLAWIVGLVVWIVSIVRFAKREVPAVRQDDLDRRAIQKYLPKRRK
jgi:peptidoglycan/LPS O-acetylase OafA/YrhL